MPEEYCILIVRQLPLKTWKTQKCNNTFPHSEHIQLTRNQNTKTQAWQKIGLDRYHACQPAALMEKRCTYTGLSVLWVDISLGLI